MTLGIITFAGSQTYEYKYADRNESYTTLTIDAYASGISKELAEYYGSPPPPDYSREGLKSFLKKQSILYGLSEKQERELTAVVTCESNWKFDAYNKLDEWAGGSYGVAQYLPSTWKYFNKLRETNMDYLNPYHQLDMTAWAFANHLQYHWSCYNRLYGIPKGS